VNRYQTSLKALLIVLVIALIIDIGMIHPALLGLVLLGLPLWAPFVIMYLPPNAARRAFREIGMLAIILLIFLLPHTGNRDPWSLWSWFIIGGSLWLTVTLWLGYVGSKERFQRLNPGGLISPSREGAAPDPSSPLWDRELDG
jgi:hypothetical protein